MHVSFTPKHAIGTTKIDGGLRSVLDSYEANGIDPIGKPVGRTEDSWISKCVDGIWVVVRERQWSEFGLDDAGKLVVITYASSVSVNTGERCKEDPSDGEMASAFVDGITSYFFKRFNRFW